MTEFKRNWNVYGIDEPLLFPIKRAGQPEIHLARLLREFFEFDGGTCIFNELEGEILMEWDKSGVAQKWTISGNRGCSTPNKARNVDRNSNDLYLTIKDADLAQSLRDLLVSYSQCKIDLSRIIGIGGEGTVLKDSLGRLNLLIITIIVS